MSPKENNWKLFHSCDVIPENITNYFIRHQSEGYIIIMIMTMVVTVMIIAMLYKV